MSIDIMTLRKHIRVLETKTLKEKYPDTQRIAEQVQVTDKEAQELLKTIPTRIGSIIASMDALHRFYYNSDIWKHALPGPNGFVHHQEGNYGWNIHTVSSIRLPCVGETMADLANELVQLTNNVAEVWEFMKFYTDTVFDNEVDGTSVVKTVSTLTDGSLIIWDNTDDYEDATITYKTVTHRNDRIRIKVVEDK